MGALGADERAHGMAESECTICLEWPSTHAGAPCGHVCVCGVEACHAIIMRDAACPIFRAGVCSLMPAYRDPGVI